MIAAGLRWEAHGGAGLGGQGGHSGNREEPENVLSCSAVPRGVWKKIERSNTSGMASEA